LSGTFGKEVQKRLLLRHVGLSGLLNGRTLLPLFGFLWNSELGVWIKTFQSNVSFVKIWQI